MGRSTFAAIVMFLLALVAKLSISRGSLLTMETIENMNTSNVIVTFSPHVSILDTYYKSRYSATDLIPMIAKVATRFEKIFIQVFAADYEQKRSNIYSPLAAATYNCLPSTKKRIKVYLGTSIVDIFTCDQLYFVIKETTNLANMANERCEGTIDTIFINLRQEFSETTYPNFTIPTCNLSQVFSSKFKWEPWILYSEYCHYQQYYKEALQPSVVLVTYPEIGQFGFSNDQPSCGLNIKNHFEKLKIIKYETLPNIGENINKNLAYWAGMFNDPLNMYVVDRAFDNFKKETETKIRAFTNGWFYLLEDPGMPNISADAFQEKLQISNQVEYEEDPRNFQWLRTMQPFNKNQTGITSSILYKTDRIHKEFCWTLTAFTSWKILKVYDITTLTPLCGITNSIMITILDVDYPTINYLTTLGRDKFTLLISPHKAMVRINDTKYTITVLDAIQQAQLQYGYFLTLSSCTLQQDLHELLANLWALSDGQSKMYVFFYQEMQDRIMLSPTRMFQIRQALFDKCIHFVKDIKKSSAGIGFVLVEYYQISNFYESPTALQNYVKYINYLTTWAAGQENIVIFIGNDKDKYSLESGSSVGWYSYDVFTKRYINKREQALQISESLFPETKNATVSVGQPVGLSKQQMIIIVCMILLLVSIIGALGVYFIRRQNKMTLTESELLAFFEGKHQNDNSNDSSSQNVPYDKNKYEISEDMFKIDTSVMLGCGEFGTVYHGTITKTSGELAVAVKTTNSQKSHKTMLIGLLYEIKVLAYIGKHANITELIGANTSYIKDGRVYVFLELCHLGSLEKTLRKLRPTDGTSFRETLGNDNEMRYLNSNAISEIILDTSLSCDLYRWSTEICNGMAYLASKHVVHADLATRNVLLNLRREAKICDFGLSRKLYNYSNYVKTQQEPLPWKWMAPESLRFMHFNEKTDVWAYGITLWEIYSLGSTPYAGLSWDANFVQMLNSGLRLSKPEFEDKDMYKIMQNCWEIRPERQPTFTEMLAKLATQDI